MLNEEEKYYELGFKFIVGCDEAGRGPLCGPVVAAACILPISFNDELINDSKKLTEKKRNEAFKLIKDNAIAYGIGVVNATEIDKINIYEASRKAMMIAINKVKEKINLEHVLVDAMPLPELDIDSTSIIKGDLLSISISAASVIAKVERDKMMIDLDKLYPEYGFKNHKGYPTKKHIEAINKYGIIDGYRKSYGPVKKVLGEWFYGFRK